MYKTEKKQCSFESKVVYKINGFLNKLPETYQKASKKERV